MPDPPKETWLKSLWNDLSQTPRNLWTFSTIVAALGLLFIAASKIPSPFGWKSHGPAEFARDVGIALLVAPLVTIIYEGGTRRSARLTELREYINAAMVSFTTKEMWREIHDQIVHRNLTRRNVEITITYRRELADDDGNTIPVPEGVAVLEVNYEYDLFRYVGTSERVWVRHALDFHMWDDALRVPCFNSATVIKEGAKTEYGKNSPQIYDQNLGIVEIPVALSGGESAHIITNRFEKIFIPGMYIVIMPDIVTQAEEATNTKTITLRIKGLPDHLEANATVWFGPHHDEFKKEPDKLEWNYRWPMLAGQGISVVFTKKTGVAIAESSRATEERSAA